MTDIAINSRKFNFHPGTRPLEEGESYEKTIIAVVGIPFSGKSTLCDLLLNDNINYISTDAICIQRDNDIRPVQDFLDKYGYEARFHLGKLAEIINKECCSLFMDYLFRAYIEENENQNILFEGYLLTFTEIWEMLKYRCRKKGYRIWKVERSL